MTSAPLVEIENLRVVFYGDAGRVTHAVDGVDLAVPRGATLGVVGESGCGKSVTVLAVMGLLPKQDCDVSGAIRFDGVDLLHLPDRALRDLRGDRLAMIFQEPMTSLIRPTPSASRSSRRSCATAAAHAARLARAPSRCCAGCAFPRPRSASTITRTNSPAACASAP
jgi:ABC-type dipeptide/oligopeptide/nickel transport system ATPase component